ncbi:MAG: DUF2339 domain-containing protein, partial [Chloroflexota bacterium]|nr:DUF2339 domain-containing protein [Chloroflexota bacterium]
IWAVLGAGLAWLGLRRQRVWAHLWGFVVHGLAGLIFLYEAVDAAPTVGPLFTNYLYISTVILSLAALTSAYLLQRSRPVWPRLAPLLSLVLLMVGLGWWFAGGFAEMFDKLASPYLLSGLLAFVALSCAAAEFIGGRLGWWALRTTILGLLPLATLITLQQWLDGDYVLAGGGWIAWPLVFLVHLLMLRRWTTQRWVTLYHAGGVWLLTLLLTRLALWHVDQQQLGKTWQAVTVLGVPTLILWAIGPLQERMPWPVAARPFAYAAVAAAPLALFLGLAATLISLTLPGDSAPLPYLPLLNGLDVAIVGLLAVLWAWWQQSRSNPALIAIIGVSGWLLFAFTFFLVNAGVARAVHHLAGVPFQFDALFASTTLQTTYAIFWSVLALVLMLTAHVRGQNGGWTAVWYGGAALLGVTVLKLFLVDLAQTGTIARIVSFISVGLLILVIAYFWPAPPQKRVVEV